ncbi:MAG: hypothetical protein AB7N65_25590 [Vicinamibacterales bacterium]
MAYPAFVRRLPMLALVVVVYVVCGFTARAAEVPTWSSAHGWHLDANGDDGFMWVSNATDAHATAWQRERDPHLQLVEPSVRALRQAAPELASLAPSAVTDTSDQSDASARVEARAGPIITLQCRALLAVSQDALRSRTRSGAAPRAPPVVLPLA